MKKLITQKRLENLPVLPICPRCGSMSKFDDHVDTDYGPDTADIYQCENDECGRYFYVARRHEIEKQFNKEITRAKK